MSSYAKHPDRDNFPPPGGADVPPAPAWAGDIVTYSEALDHWLAQLRRRCDDPAWREWYAAMRGEPHPPRVDLPPHPEPGDRGWRRWWQEWREAYRAAGASADGIDGPPPVHRLSRKGRRIRWRKAVAAVVRREIAAAIPPVLAAVTEALRRAK